MDETYNIVPISINPKSQEFDRNVKKLSDIGKQNVIDLNSSASSYDNSNPKIEMNFENEHNFLIDNTKNDENMANSNKDSKEMVGNLQSPKTESKPVESNIFIIEDMSEDTNIVENKTKDLRNNGAVVESNGGMVESNGKNVANDFLSISQSVQRMSIMEEESLKERMRKSILKQCSDAFKRNSKYTKDLFRETMENQDLLNLIFRLFDVDRRGKLIQEELFEFLKSNFSEEKQLDFLEQLESVSYVLCGETAISPEKFRQIFTAKGITDKLFRVIDTDSDGLVDNEEIMEFLTTVSNTSPKSGLDSASLEWLEQLFKQTVGVGKEIKREDFQKIVTSKNPFFTDRVFEIFDLDSSGSISLHEFIDSCRQFAGQTTDDKIKFLFRVYDLDGDGLIQLKELRHVMKACMDENGMTFSEEQLDDLSMALFEDADSGKIGAITFESLKAQLKRHEGLIENLSISIDRWIVPPKPKQQPMTLRHKLRKLIPYQLSRSYVKNNYVYLTFIAAFVILNAGLFISRAVQYRKSNGFVILARACGQCLNFNCAFVLVLMLRQSITFLRTRGFGDMLPLDNHIYLHKVTGICIVVYSFIHTAMHLCNFSLIVLHDPVTNSSNFTLSEWLMTNKPSVFGLVPGCANPTGLVLFIILAVMFICSQPFIRRSGSFEIFYWTHLLYIPFWLLLIFHGPNFWKWFLIPGVIYLLERILRVTWMSTERGKTYVSSGLLLPSKVTHLVIKRPAHFDYCPGDYVFVNIPAIAKYEWHPFTISSAPEQEDYLWLHIRGVGQWTVRLYEYFENEQKKLHRGEILPAGEGLDLLGRKTERKQSRKTSDTDCKIGRFIQQGGQTNTGFVRDIEEVNLQEIKVTSPSIKSSTSLQSAPNVEGRSKLLKLPGRSLEKTLSLPDMQTRTKRRQRVVALRDYTRSESEGSFDSNNMLQANNLSNLGLAYLSPQNKSLAHNYRHMRNKPTIIAFNTPSLDECYQENGIIRAVRRLSKSLSPDRNVEEGTKPKSDNLANLSNANQQQSEEFANYPVGKPLEIYLDGPYGAPSSHMFRAQHAVLIATGIGVTPFASILQSIMHRYWKARHTCPKCDHKWSSEIPSSVMHLRKVDFFWINREQRSFEWFVNLLSQLEIEQAELGGAMERFLDMHMYITSALQKADMKAVGLQLALDLLHEKEKRDLITGLKTRTIAGRPNWDKVFTMLRSQAKGKITVFYCGPPQLAKQLRIKCHAFGFGFRKEVF